MSFHLNISPTNAPRYFDAFLNLENIEKGGQWIEMGLKNLF